MTGIPGLTTERLTLVPFSDQYLTAAYVGWLNDPDVTRFSENRHVHHTLESCREYMRQHIRTPHYFWAITITDSTAHIGNITATLDEFNLVADVGLLIGDKSFWGSGFGTEAWQAVLGYLLTEVQCRKIEAGAMAINAGMISIFGKSKMLEEGRRSKHFLLNDQEIDLVHYAIFGK